MELRKLLTWILHNFDLSITRQRDFLKISLNPLPQISFLDFLSLILGVKEGSLFSTAHQYISCALTKNKFVLSYGLINNFFFL